MSKFDTPTTLSNRAILTLSGPDRKTFLQGLITNNVDKIAENHGLYAALLTPQGKYLHDFFITERDNILYLDCEKDRLPDLFRRLMMYKLRADVEILDCTDLYAVLASPIAFEDSVVAYTDPRHSNMGFRAVVEITQAIGISSHEDQYHAHRLSLGIPDGSNDFEVDKTLILEGNVEYLNGVDFEKGCYVGQEVTARMKHRTSLKKRMLPVDVSGPLPTRGTEIKNETGKKIGDIRSSHNKRAIGYFRLSDMTYGQSYSCGTAKVTPWKPDWLPATEQ